MKTFFDHELQSYNTFRIASTAKIFVIIENNEDIKNAIDSYGKPSYILGGWSNVILPAHIDGVVWHPHFLYKKDTTTDDTVLLTIGWWENRHQTVTYTIEKWRWWIENLIAIPGNVWASPVQNIGAYWVELQDIFAQCTVYDFDTQEIGILIKDQCHFWYRSSIFKDFPWKYMVIDITLSLSLKRNAVITYKPIQDHFTALWIQEPTQQEIGSAIEGIRWSKLPKPQELWNCGSFFQNPIVDDDICEQLLEKHPTMPHFIQDNGQYKLSAAWLIDNAWLKWYSHWNIWTYEKQPLVIVQYGWATKQDVILFSWYIIDTVYNRFWVTLQREVNIW